MLKVTNNTVINGHSLLKVTAPHTMEILVDGNTGFNLSGELVNAQIYVDKDRLNAFTAQITPHLGELPLEQASALTSILKDLAAQDPKDKTGPLSQLSEFGKSVASGVISGVITGFLGG